MLSTRDLSARPRESHVASARPAGLRQSVLTTMMMHSLAYVLFHGRVALRCVPSSWT